MFDCHCLQLGPKKTVALYLIEEKWLDLALPKEQFDDLVRVGSFSGQVEWNRFFALAASALGEVRTMSPLKKNKRRKIQMLQEIE
jgi:hypothetical protein